MKDPQRLSAGSDSEVERMLLRAGRERPPTGAKSRAKSRALVAASWAGTASSLTTAKAAAEGTAALAKAGSIAVLKWFVIAGVAGVGAVSGIQTLRAGAGHTGRTSVPASSFVAREASPAVSAEGVATSAPALEPFALPSPAAQATEAGPASAPVHSLHPARASASTLHAELATLERARSAVAGHEGARALQILDAYGAEFPRGTMAPEAAVLRIEILAGAGDRTSTERLARAFLRDNPESPYASRIQSVLAASNP